MNKTCARCGLAEKRGRVFEAVDSGGPVFYLCVGCAQVAYKMKDAVMLGDSLSAASLSEDFEQNIIENAAKPLVKQWFEEYKKGLNI